MGLDAAAALAAATTITDQQIAAVVAVKPPGYVFPSDSRTITINAKRDELLALFQAITANAVVSPTGSPTVLTAPNGGGAVTGTGKIT